MKWTVIYLIFIVMFFYVITRPPRCPRCGKRMKPKYNQWNGVSYDECPKCGYSETRGVDDFI